MSRNTRSLLSIRLLGGFCLSYSEGVVAGLDKPRVQALLAYLVLHASDSHPRTQLAFMFWPESDEKQALGNLRNVIHSLRQMLPEAGSFLLIDNRQIAWNANASYTLDVDLFRDHIKVAEAALEEDRPSSAIENYKIALEYYRGRLLPAFYDNWLERERDRLEREAVQALSSLVGLLKEEGVFEGAISYSKIWIQINELNETCHYALIEAHALQGDRAAALAAYQDCETQLMKELGVEPSDVLKALKQKVLRNEISGVKPASAKEPVAAPLASPSSKTDTEKKRPRLFWKPLLLGIGLSALALWWFATPTGEAAPEDKSIAILPFENRSMLEEDRFFTDGIHGDLLTQISHIGEIKTISRTSVIGYRETNKNLRQIGDELGVSNILEGDVQRAGEQVRINVQLIDAKTDALLWAEGYTRELSAENIFSIQSEIAEEIAAALHAVLSPQERERIEKLPTSNLAALEAYYRGIAEPTSTTGYLQKIEHFERAIELDPEFALAHARLAWVHLKQVWMTSLSIEEQVAESEPLINRALELDPESSAAYDALGLLWRRKDDFEKSEAALLKAIELNPNNDMAHSTYANELGDHGEYEKALRHVLKARELNPYELEYVQQEAQALKNLNRIDEALLLLERAAREHPDSAIIHRRLGLFYQSKGLEEEALIANRKAYAADPGRPQLALVLAKTYSRANAEEEEIFWRERAAELSGETDLDANSRIRLLLLKGELDEADALWWKEKPGGVPGDITLLRMTGRDIDAGQEQRALKRYEEVYPEWLEPDFILEGSDKDDLWLLSEIAGSLKAVGDLDQMNHLLDQLIVKLEALPESNRTLNQGLRAAALWDDKKLVFEIAARKKVLGLVPDGNMFPYFWFNTLREDPEVQAFFAETLAEQESMAERFRAMEAAGELAPIPDVPEN
ncbi:Bacterial transcriptional activator domain family [Verrucomicrobiia bacterium DG1235]|nr:Bacterial transcriptional activator domain family [Verrucomicrobiae bacterium DG1235]